MCTARSTIGKSKPNCVQKFAQNIYYSKSFMIHILTDNWLESWRTKLKICMYPKAEQLNMYLISVFTSEITRWSQIDML